mgnify:CR=1 FL=1
MRTKGTNPTEGSEGSGTSGMNEGSEGSGTSGMNEGSEGI